MDIHIRRDTAISYEGVGELRYHVYVQGRPFHRALGVQKPFRDWLESYACTYHGLIGFDARTADGQDIEHDEDDPTDVYVIDLESAAMLAALTRTKKAHLVLRQLSNQWGAIQGLLRRLRRTNQGCDPMDLPSARLVIGPTMGEQAISGIRQWDSVEQTTPRQWWDKNKARYQ